MGDVFEYFKLPLDIRDLTISFLSEEDRDLCLMGNLIAHASYERESGTHVSLSKFEDVEGCLLMMSFHGYALQVAELLLKGIDEEGSCSASSEQRRSLLV